MGIPRLKRILEPHAERTKIPASEIVIDGPSLAYHIYYFLKGNLNNSPFDQPSNELLGQTAIQWLDRIQSCGHTVSAIYFDGFLPQEKREERISRLLGLSSDLRIYFNQCPDGLPPKKTSTGQQQPWSSRTRNLPTKRPPYPPFLVPAVLEALRNSPKYGSLTKLKPGEADVFCAQHVSQQGGIILTSDSDLLVHDLGQDGSVIFYTDIEIDLDSKTLIALLYRPSSLCKSLMIDAVDGISRLAHALSLDYHTTLEQAVESTRAEPDESYPRFTDQYTAAEIITHPEIGDDILLDPRTSEITLQCLVACTAGAPQDYDLAMHLPFLTDSQSRTSAWEASRPIRELAYGILLFPKYEQKQDSLPSVHEFRRLQVASSGTPVKIPPTASELDQQATKLIDTLTRIRAVVGDTPIVWDILSIYEDIVSTLSQGKPRPLSLELLLQEAKGTLQQHSWDFVHFLAQVQATLYSARMVQQIIDFKRQQPDKGNLSPAILQLGVHLRGLPGLKDFPTLKDFLPVLRSVREGEGMSVFAKLCDDSEDIARQIAKIRNPQPEGRKRKGNSRGDRGTKRKSTTSHVGDDRAKAAVSRNPFSVLGDYD
ncbi:XPG domain containing domain containing protein [Naviculisporaceae sp. PSN 640]